MKFKIIIKRQSTETLLLRLLSDVYAAIDSSQLTLLALFDVSAAFDTVDHELVLKRLNVSFGLSGTLLLWLRSYLTERSLCVVHGSFRSSWVPAPFGLPQGSVLAPLLFIIYTSDLASLSLPLMLCSPNCMQMMFRPTSIVAPLMLPRLPGL